mmetsp:Transcript_66914/g.157729  ORF Transcript_66914/g.157729 Transcript_66914/m.157729 type:complete len:213 (+) Transcript_66914:2083-2721(+)
MVPTARLRSFTAKASDWQPAGLALPGSTSPRRPCPWAMPGLARVMRQRALPRRRLHPWLCWIAASTMVIAVPTRRQRAAASWSSSPGLLQAPPTGCRRVCSCRMWHVLGSNKAVFSTSWATATLECWSTMGLSCGYLTCASQGRWFTAFHCPRRSSGAQCAVPVPTFSFWPRMPGFQRSSTAFLCRSPCCPGPRRSLRCFPRRLGRELLHCR